MLPAWRFPHRALAFTFGGMKAVRIAWKIARNKYLVTLVALGVWLLFFDKNDLFSQIDLTRQVNKMKADTLYYSQEIRRNSEGMNALKTDSKELEKFARENYLMKRDSEDIYIFVRESR